MPLRCKRCLAAVFLAVLAMLPLPAAAIPYVPPYQKIEPGHDPALEHLRKNEFDRVIEIEKRALAKNPTDLTSYLMLTMAYLGKGDEKRAVEQAEAVKKVNYGYSSVLYGTIGRFYTVKKRYHRGLVYLQRSLAIKEDPDTLKQIAAIYLNQGLLKSSRVCYERLLSSKPDYMNLSRVYLAEESYEKAVAYARKAVNEDTKSSGAYLVLGTGYILTDRPDLAKVNFSILKEINPEFFIADYFLGLVNTIQKNYDEALSRYKSLLSSSPRFRDAQLSAAAVLHMKGETQLAKAAVQRAIEADPLDPLPHAALGNIHISEGDFAGADEQYQKAGELFPEFGMPGFHTARYFKAAKATSSAHFTLALMYNRAGLHREVVKAAETVRKDEGIENPFLTIARARSEAKLGNGASAEAMLKMTVRHHPGLASAEMELGNLYASRKEYVKAIASYKGAYRAAPDPKTAVKMAEAYASAGHVGLAVHEYRNLIAAFPEAVAGYKNISILLAGDRSTRSEALQFASKGVSINPEDAGMKDVLGWALYRLDRPAEAIEAYKGALKNGSGDPMVLYHLGLAYERTNDRARAAESMEKALDINEEFEKAGDARKALKRLTGFE